jgi:hypothetical protein
LAHGLIVDTNTLVVQADTGRVGIGTTAPGEKLEISGGNILLSDTAASYYLRNTNNALYQESGGDLRIKVAGSDVITFENTGNVGIATTSPAAQFTVNSAASNAFVVTSGGSVGIGTVSPSSRLYVAGTGTTKVTVQSTDGGQAELNLKSGSNGGSIYQPAGTDDIRIYNSSDVITFKNTGNVGIGTTTPEEILHLYSLSSSAPQLKIDGYDPAIIMNKTDDTRTASILFKNEAGSAQMSFDQLSTVFRIRQYDNIPIEIFTNNTQAMTIEEGGEVGIGVDPDPDFGLEITASTTNGYLGVSNSASGDGNVFIIDGSGNVGIGTTTPSDKLEIAGNIELSAGTPQIKFYETDASSDNKRWKIYPASERLTFTAINDADSAANPWLYVDRTGTTIDYVTFPNGNVGIGTTGPGELLHVSGGNMALELNRYLLFDKGNGDNSKIGYVNVATPYVGLFVDSAAPHMVITNTGNVGIGTTTPGTLLHLGPTAISQGLGSNSLFVSGDIEAEGDVWFDGSTATTTIAGGLVVDTNTLYVDPYDGRVGIGTATPNYALEVAGTGRFGSHLYLNTIGTMLRFYDVDLYRPSGYGGLLYVNNHFTVKNRTYLGAGGTAIAVNPLDVGGGAVIGSGYAGSATAPTDGLAVQGNVGIGTTTPYAKLTINESDDFAFGSFNEKVIDDMESSVLNWTDDTNTTTSTERSIVKVGGQSLKITAGATEDEVVRKTFGSAQDWSSYERISFWIYADRLATSTATTTQLLSFQVYDPQNPGMITHNIRFQEEDRWQYEEVALDATGTAAYDGVTYIQFRTDFGSIGDINFYIDQIRAYNSSERAAEMFVDRDGTLVVTGRNGVELVAPNTGSGQLPGVKVDSATVEIGQPLSVNVGGDVGFDYDIQFLNTGLAQITSEGPLRIAAGDPNHAENLTLTTQGTGDVIVELSQASSTLTVTQVAYASTTAFEINSEATATSTPSGGLLRIITDVNSDENEVFKIDAAGDVYVRGSKLEGSGLAIYGDGSDGDVTIAADTTLTRDMFYNNLTISAGYTLNPNGYRIFVKGTLTNNGTIARNGNDGTTDALAAAPGGAALPAGTIGGSGAGGDSGGAYAGSGGSGGGVIVIAAKTIDNSGGTISANGGAGGSTADPAGTAAGAGGAGGGATAAKSGGRALPVAISGWETEAVAGLIQGGAGGGGGGGSGSDGLAGESVAPALGGAGGAGGDNNTAGNGGGGGGGGGGTVIIIYNSATWGIETADGGAGGTGGNNGVAGSAGTIIKIANK